MNASCQTLTPALVLLMSVATGLSVVSNACLQPLLHTFARQVNLSVSSAGFIVMTAQSGYACDLRRLMPSGDVSVRRGPIAGRRLMAAGSLMTLTNLLIMWRGYRPASVKKA